MTGFFKKIFRPAPPPSQAPDPHAIVYENWSVDFSKPETIRFPIKAEPAYDAKLEARSLMLGLKKPNCLAWLENPWFRYRDQIIEGRIRLDPRGGYAAAGFMFRGLDEGTCYAALVSNRGCFRLDVLLNGLPQTLIGWTGLPAPPGTPDTSRLQIIAYGNHLILLINGQWAAELNDHTIPAGRLSFALASYEGTGPAKPDGPGGLRYTAAAFLESLRVESRIGEVARAYEYWTGAAAIGASSRLRLAETFTAQGRYNEALLQLKKAWKQPERPQEAKELLLACRLALSLERFDEAEAYGNACIAAAEGDTAAEALIERARLLYARRRFLELKTHGEAAAARIPPSPILLTLLGHAYRELGDRGRAAAAYDRAFALDTSNGLPAKNAGRAYESLGQPGLALDRYLQAGRAFLGAEAYEDLGALLPELLALGPAHWEARGLEGKWAFAVERWDMAAASLARAEALRLEAGDRAEPDPAVFLLQGLLLARQGRRAGALPLLEAAAALRPDYPLFRFKLAENRFLLSGNPHDAALCADIEAALALAPDDGWIANLAAQIALSRGCAEEAARHLERAARALGDLPAIQVNRGLLYSLQGSLDKALEALNSPEAADAQGIMANCAGNLLCQARRFEEASAYYEKALAADPDNQEFLMNRSSALMALGRYGAADELLARAHTLGPNPGVLERIAQVSIQKGEYLRSETACRSALDLDPRHVPSLLTLAWLYAVKGQRGAAEDLIRRLEELPLEGDALKRREDLKERLGKG
ncbi:MAG: tetratricopeptide repeat protein [Treponema sp.]|jgi:tetratricopeptide (TPR) repeat protein|nr:tetratricopeptide repeat protein [Treponema sp.]